MSKARAARARASLRTRMELFGPRWFLGLAAGGRLGPRSEKLDPLRYDLRALALAAAVFVLKFSRAQPAFNVNLPSSGEILGTGFSELPENHNVVPFNTLLLLPLFVRVGLVGRNRETDDWLTGRQIPQLRISAQISDNHALFKDMTLLLCAPFFQR